MKLQPDRFDTLAVNAHGPGWVAINGQQWTQSVVLSAHGDLYAWDCASFEALTPAHFERLLSSQPELVLLGTGNRLRFAHPSLLRSLTEHGIGVECMDTPAACRTYNILAGEGRKVVAALLLQAP